MDEVKVPLDSGISDCVYSQNIYHEFHQLEASLAEFMRLLKPGGKFVAIDWKPGDTPHGPPQEVRVPTQKIMGDLAKCGFVAVKSHDVLPYHSFVTALKPE